MNNTTALSDAQAATLLRRANAVAQELIRQGVPASRVLIDAVGDSQPVYYESMPQGEEGNRRAEIFVQG